MHWNLWKNFEYHLRMSLTCQLTQFSGLKSADNNTKSLNAEKQRGKERKLEANFVIYNKYQENYYRNDPDDAPPSVNWKKINKNTVQKAALRQGLHLGPRNVS